MYGTATLKWTAPRTIERINKLGFFERTDISRYDVWHKKAEDPGNGTVTPFYGSEREYRLTGLEIGVKYLVKVRAIDYGQQVGEWASPINFLLSELLKNIRSIECYETKII